MASAPGPPPSTRGNSVASVHLRRLSTKKEAEVSLTSFNQEGGSDSHGRRRVQFQRADLFHCQSPRQEQLESSLTIASLQKNVAALVAINRREKNLSTSLRNEVARLTEALAKLNEPRETDKEEEKTESADLKSVCDGNDHFLPDIFTGAMAKDSLQPLQQHTQMVVSMQRKAFSLENQCQLLTANNQKLLVVIGQLERAQIEKNFQLENLRQHNARLSKDAESRNNTILTQSSVIGDLRSTVEKLSQDMKHFEHLHITMTRCQRELDAVKVREKQLLEKHEQLKISAKEEKEVLNGECLVLQQRLLQHDTAIRHLTVSEIETKRLQKENESLHDDLIATKSRCVDLQTQVDQLNERFKVDTKIKMDKDDIERRLLQKLEVSEQSQETQKVDMLEKVETLSVDCQKFTDLLEARDEEVATLMKQVMRLEDCVEEREHRYKGMQDDFYKVTTELQGLKQLSHDDTVQALQMARQKAASYEALTLLNEEKKDLEDQLRLLQEQLQFERNDSQKEKEAMLQIQSVLDTRERAIKELRKENAVLLEQVHKFHGDEQQS